MHLAFIVSTVGRVDAVRRLLDSLRGQLCNSDQVVVVAQGRLEELSELVREYQLDKQPVIITQSERGVSRGRNSGVEALSSRDNPLLLFPNDTSVMTPETIAYLHSLPENVQYGGMRLNAANSTLPPWPVPGTVLDRRSVWAVIEPGMFCRRSLFRSVGGFDPDIGTGCRSPWQSGECTDLILRIKSEHPEIEFTWLPSNSAWVTSPETAEGLSSSERHQKLRAYARGYGFILRRWRYPMWDKVRALLGAATTAIRHVGRTPADACCIFIGRLEGMSGRTLGRNRIPYRAVDR